MKWILLMAGIVMGLMIMNSVKALPITSVDYEKNTETVTDLSALVSMSSPQSIACTWINPNSDYRDCSVTVEITNNRTLDLLLNRLPGFTFAYGVKDLALSYSDKYVADENGTKTFTGFTAMSLAPSLPSGKTVAVRASFKSPFIVKDGVYQNNHFDFSISSPFVNLVLDPDINACSVLTSNNVYTMNGSISGASGSCMQFNGADNVTFECNGFLTDGDDSGTDYGFWLNSSNGGSYNVTIQNCTVTDFYYGVYLSASSNNTLLNITARSNPSYGFYLTGSNYTNVFNVNASGLGQIYGFYLSSSYYNNVTSAIIWSHADYGLRVQTGGYNNLSSINSSYNKNGIDCYTCSNSAFIDMVTNYNTNSGILIENGGNKGNTFANIIAQENTNRDVGLDSISTNSQCMDNFSNITGSSNLPIYYYNSSVTLSNQILSELILCNANNSTLLNITLHGSSSKKNNGLYSYLTNYTSFTTINSSYAYYGLRLDYGYNNTLDNITTNSNNLYGIYLYYAKNYTFINATVSSSQTGFYLAYSSGITVNGALIASSSSQDYSLSNAGVSNNFTNTNFTVARKVNFVDTTSNFNYQNNQSSALWLKTNLSASKLLTRLISIWAQDNITWNDSVTATTVTAYYLLEGLIPSGTYSVYNSTVNPTYNLTATSNGQLSFPIKLTTTVQQIRVLNATFGGGAANCWTEDTVNHFVSIPTGCLYHAEGLLDQMGY